MAKTFQVDTVTAVAVTAGRSGCTVVGVAMVRVVDASCDCTGSVAAGTTDGVDAVTPPPARALAAASSTSPLSC